MCEPSLHECHRAVTEFVACDLYLEEFAPPTCVIFVSCAGSVDSEPITSTSPGSLVKVSILRSCPIPTESKPVGEGTKTSVLPSPPGDSEILRTDVFRVQKLWFSGYEHKIQNWP